MTGMELVLLAIALLAVSGLPGLFLRRDSLTGQHIATALVSAGALSGIAGALLALGSDVVPEALLDWRILGAEFDVAVDGLSAFFLLPVFLVGMLGSIYGLSYWKQTDHLGNARKLAFFYGLTVAGMALLIVARTSVVFLIGWEIMALSAFFLVSTEDDKAEVRAAGLMYLIATHFATLALFGLFALLRSVNGSFALQAPAAHAVSPEMAAVMMALAVFGFGLKAGIMPMHIWLPSAHAMAPSHVSALMSGVLIKIGIYGLVRFFSFFPDPPLWWGGVVLGLGAVSGILGVAFAIGQHDIKRLLAYHSIENIGIIVMGLGLALIGRNRDVGEPAWVLLGMGAALLHVWNHALFKSLLFFSAGSVIHATHTRDIDHFGGLARAMPRTALAFVVGAVAICGLPPLNGFVSEWLLYLGLFDVAVGTQRGSATFAVFAAPALALIGALALACFVKAFSATFLGTPRSGHVAHAHESPVSMTAPMLILGACCFTIGLVPQLFAGILGRGIAAWAGAAPGSVSILEHARLDIVSWLAFGLAALLLTATAALWFSWQRRPVDAQGTWDCGFAGSSPRIQYTSSSFAQFLVDLFGWALRPRVRQPEPLPLFPKSVSFHSEVGDTVLDRFIMPVFHATRWVFAQLRFLQQGGVHSYLLYIFVTLVVLLLWH